MVVCLALTADTTIAAAHSPVLEGILFRVAALSPAVSQVLGRAQPQLAEVK